MDDGNLNLSIVHFRHDSSSTIHRNEEAVRLCHLKGTLNDRHRQEDGEKGQEHIWWWGSCALGIL